MNTRAFWLRRWLWLVAGLGLACATLAQTSADSAADGIVGDWLVQSRDAIIRIERQGDTYGGTIVWQLHDTYGPEDGPELNGKTVTDRHNPDPSLRSRPLTGLHLLWGLRYDASEHAWVDGHVYNSDNGKDYHCQVHLPSADRLVLHGYIGITLLGGNTTWTRTREPFPAVARSAADAH
ncbi:DUF2147 domain-containing protein [Dyella sp. C11]|uniref:DUF2147 domain-containing protein n=1 Tax=Dyella sp. C11 TaxID=2126991 RepID=UPI00130092E0|nr:DUF2147 domain-containing protein [Dyella sp. C11]